MPIPRYVDPETKQRYDVSLVCRCGYAVIKDRLTKKWEECPLCGEKLETKRINYD